MNRKFYAIPALAISFAMIASAQGKVGVINIQGAIVGTKDGQKAAQDLETKLGPKRKDLEKQQTDLKGLQESLQRGGNAMSETAKSELARTIDQKTKSFNRNVEDAEAEYQQEQQKALGSLGQKMMAVIDKYAKDNSYSLIIDVSSPNTPVLYASNTIDVTKDIVDLYDKNAPSMPAVMPTSNSARPAQSIPGTPRPATPAATPVKKP